MKHGRLLIVHPGALGDVVVSLPPLERLRPGCRRMDITGQGWLGGFFQRMGVFDAWHATESRHFSSLFTPSPDREAVASPLHYDRILLLSFSHDLEEAVGRIAGSRAVVRIPPRPRPEAQIHVTDYLEQEMIARRLLDPPALAGKTDPAAVRRGNPFPAGESSARVLLHPGSGSPRKNWPLEFFARLGHLLRQDGFQPEFLFGPADQDLKTAFKASFSAHFTFHTPPDFDALFGLFENAGGFIGNDSGVTHLGAHLGLRTVSVFGPSDPLRWRPRGPRVRVVRAACACPPCFESQKTDCGSPRCLTDISPARVLEAFRGMFP